MRSRQIGRTYTCDACQEPSALIENIGKALVCSPCVARLRATARSMRARKRAPSREIHAAFRNSERRKQRSER